MKEPSGRSLSALGLMTPDSLDCPEGGQHHVLESDLEAAAVEEGGVVRCRKCGVKIMLRSIRELE